ncbi:MAG: hypothetical protein ABI182_05440 [Candidatus Baltobacteraceae bacterium]
MRYLPGCVGVGSVLIALTLLGVTLPARADTTTVGVTLNGPSGAHIEQQEVQAVPFVPLPMIEIEHKHKRLRLRAEIVPPIGPVPLAQGDGGFGLGQDPRLSYLAGEVTYSLNQGRFEFGVGQTILNQRTLYPPSPIAQASRVVGARYVIRSVLYSSLRERLEATLAFNPSMRGVQYTIYPSGLGLGPIGHPTPPFTLNDPESASMVDATLRWSIPRNRYTFSYGLRYINYVASYTNDHRLADRNHLFMPFMGLDWQLPLKHDGESSQAARAISTTAAATLARPVRADRTSFGMTLNGTAGSYSADSGEFTIPASFRLLPIFRVEQAHKRLSLGAEGILPNSGSNLFGPSLYKWSYLNTELLYASSNSRYALGVGNTVANERFFRPQGFGSETATLRLEGLRYTALGVLASSGRGRLEARLSVNPYLNGVYSLTDAFSPPSNCSRCSPASSHSFTHLRGASLVDGSLVWSVPLGLSTFSYGLRYINQTINDGSLPGFSGQPARTFLERNSSLMPFIGVSIRPRG